MDWKRPDSILYPTVWLRCTGKTPMPDGKIPKFRIQCITEDMFEEIVDLMCNVFARDEFTCAATNLIGDSESLDEFKVSWWKFLKQKVGLVAILEEDGDQHAERPRIAGLNITGVSVKSDQLTLDMYKGVASRIIMDFILNHALKDVDMFELYGVDKYMSAFGLLVLPEFRGQGLSEQLIKARFPLGKALGLKATMTFFSPASAQRAAVKAGMKMYKEALYEDYKVDGKVVFCNPKNKSIQVMVAEI